MGKIARCLDKLSKPPAGTLTYQDSQDDWWNHTENNFQKTDYQSIAYNRRSIRTAEKILKMLQKRIRPGTAQYSFLNVIILKRNYDAIHRTVFKKHIVNQAGKQHYIKLPIPLNYTNQ